MQTKNIVWSIIGIVSILGLLLYALVVQMTNTISKIENQNLSNRDAALVKVLEAVSIREQVDAVNTQDEILFVACQTPGRTFSPSMYSTSTGQLLQRASCK